MPTKCRRCGTLLEEQRCPVCHRKALALKLERSRKRIAQINAAIAAVRSGHAPPKRPKKAS